MTGNLFASDQGVVIRQAFFGTLAFLYQARDPRIWERFFSIGNNTEIERDASAQSRLAFWEAGIKMIIDRPLGTGGKSAFRSPLGNTYIEDLGYERNRSVHNGYISIAAGWGVQGFLLVTLAFLIAMSRTWLAVKYFQQSKNENMVFLGAAILAAFFGQATTAMFGDYYDGEWFVWLAIYGLVYATFQTVERERFDQECEEDKEFLDDSVQEEEYEDDDSHWDRPTRRWVPAETRQ